MVEYLVEKGYILVDPVISKNDSILHRNYKVDKQFIENEFGL